MGFMIGPWCAQLTPQFQNVIRPRRWYRPPNRRDVALAAESASAQVASASTRR